MLFGIFEVLAPLRLSVLGASTVAIAVIFLVCTVAEAAMSPLVGQLADRRGAYPVARLGLAGCTVMAILLPLPGSLVPYAIALVAACVAFGWPWVPASAMLSAGAAYYELGQGVAFGLWNLAWGGGQAIGSAGGAGLADGEQRRGALPDPRRALRAHPGRSVSFAACRAPRHRIGVRCVESDGRVRHSSYRRSLDQARRRQGQPRRGRAAGRPAAAARLPALLRLHPDEHPADAQPQGPLVARAASSRGASTSTTWSSGSS